MGETEPSADLREMASMLWQTHVALTGSGFTEDQSLKIISELIGASLGGGGK